VSKQIGRFLIWVLYYFQPDLFVFIVDSKLRKIAENTVRNIEFMVGERGGELKRDQAYKALHRAFPQTPKRQLAVAIELAVSKMKGAIL